MTKDKWLMVAMALAFGGFFAIGLWEYAIAGTFELVVIGMVGFGLLAIAERQRRAFAASANSRQNQEH